MTTPPSPLPPPSSSARIWSSPKGRKMLFGVGLLAAGFVAWRIVAPQSTPANAPKSSTEAALDKIVDNSKAAGQVGADGVKDASGKGPDQPAGDNAELAALTEAAQKQAIVDNRRKAAEEKMLDQLAYQNYMRRAQGLTYDADLAARWDNKLRSAQASGLAAPAPPAALDKDTLQEMQKDRPDLMAQWKAMGGQGGKAPDASGGIVPTMTAGSVAGIPASIDPKTGLPVDAKGKQGLYAVNEDGSPDIEDGAIPVRLEYTPPGASQPVTVTRWVHPGYLSGRVRPVNPADLLEQDQAWRRALTESSDIPNDQTTSVAIPTRFDPSIQRVPSSQDFVAQNHYVIVLPNPKGQKTPPNPAPPGGAK